MTALNFPTSPSNGDIFDNYFYDGIREVWRLQPNIPGISSTFKVSATPPTSPKNGEIWLNSTDGNTYIYYADVDSAQWIEIGGTSGFPPDLETLNNVTITSPTTGQKLIYNGTNWVNVIDNINSLVDVNITSPVAGQKLVYDGNNWVNLEAYSLVDTLYFESNGTFTKASFPFLRAIRVKCVGGGGGGGGNPTTGANQASVAGGGGGGGYAESFITDIAGLNASVAVTRGSGANGGGASTNAGGATGGQSSFGSLVLGNGGSPGAGGSPSTGIGARNGGTGGSGTGDLVISGGRGFPGFYDIGQIFERGHGGQSHLASVATTGGSSTGTANGVLYGGGGAGSHLRSDTGGVGGGNGANGIVIVEVFA